MTKTPASELLQKKRLYEQNKISGTCVDCRKAPACSHKSRCEPCLKLRRNRTQNKIAKGICRSCKKLAPEGFTTCESCRKASAAHALARRQANRDAGLCWSCGAVTTPPYATCNACRAKARAWDHNKRFGNGGREATILRDGGECRLCGGTKQFRVHHINGDPTNHEPDNLITLCLPCHYQVHKVATYCTDLVLFNILIRQLN